MFRARQEQFMVLVSQLKKKKWKSYGKVHQGSSGWTTSIILKEWLSNFEFSVWKISDSVVKLISRKP